MQSLPKIDKTKISAEALAILDTLPTNKGGNQGHQWTKTEDEVLLAGWKTRNQAALSKALGLSVGTCRGRYRELTES